jgi:protein-S-isoprenylcysteine O-methyltransferase Ste14
MKSTPNRDLRYSVLHQRFILSVHAILLLTVMIINYKRNGYVHHEWSWGRVFGLTIFMPSFICWLLARWELAGSASYSLLPTVPRKLVKTGMYSLMEHPEYFFSTLNMLAYLLMVESEYGIIALLCVGVPVQIVRARAEERILKKRFAFQHTAYVEDIERRVSQGSVRSKIVRLLLYAALSFMFFGLVELLLTNHAGAR